jgi:hypothetical protein
MEFEWDGTNNEASFAKHGFDFDPGRLPPPFWRTRYFALHVMGKPGRRNIDPVDIRRALAMPYRRMRQPDGRVRH